MSFACRVVSHNVCHFVVVVFAEYFALQIDAHVRFVQDWDTDLIDQWKATKNESK